MYKQYVHRTKKLNFEISEKKIRRKQTELQGVDYSVLILREIKFRNTRKSAELWPC